MLLWLLLHCTVVLTGRNGALRNTPGQRRQGSMSNDTGSWQRRHLRLLLIHSDEITSNSLLLLGNHTLHHRLVLSSS